MPLPPTSYSLFRSGVPAHGGQNKTLHAALVERDARNLLNAPGFSPWIITPTPAADDVDETWVRPCEICDFLMSILGVSPEKAERLTYPAYMDGAE